MESLQQLADRGIQVGVGGQQFSNTGGNTYTPVGGGSNNTAPVGLTASPRMSLSDARGQADKAFSGLVAPMTLDEIRNREATAQGLTAQTADSVYDPAISRQKQVGAAQVSTTEGVVGQRQGFNISTAEQAYVASVENKVQDAIKEVENTKASYIAQGNLAAADRADAQLQSLNEWNSQMVIAKANYALQIMSGDREQAGLELQRAQAAFQIKQAEAQNIRDDASQNLQSEALALNAYKVAIETPVGQEFKVNGITYIGLQNAAGIDPSNISLSTDDRGYETGINKLTGEVIWKSKVPTGKTKTAASNVTVNLKNSAIGATEEEMYDPVSGILLGSYSKNNQSGVFTFFDTKGKIMNIPPSYVTKQPKAGGGVTIKGFNGNEISF